MCAFKQTNPFFVHHFHEPPPLSLWLFTRVQDPYLHNFVQATFDALKATGTDVTKGTLLIGGDGRYFNDKAIQIIIKIAAANG